MVLEVLKIEDKIKEMSGDIFRTISQSLDINTIFIARIDKATNNIFSVYNKDKIMFEELSAPLEQTYCNIAIEKPHEVTIIENTLSHEKTKMLEATKQYGMNCFIGVPIILRDGSIFGTLCAVDYKHIKFTKKHKETFSTLSNLISYIVDLEVSQVTDNFSGLYNRKFIENLIFYLDEKQEFISGLFIDLDEFKQINDLYGHNVGDKIIKESSMRIKNCVGNKGYCVRVSGDEFLIITKLIDYKQLENLAKLLIEKISEPYTALGKPITISASIGIAANFDPAKMETLLQHSDEAMYLAKKAGKNQYKFYNVSTIKNSGFTKKDLMNAIKLNEFRIYYQPQYSISKNRIVGLEALIRWEHPIFGFVTPNRFITLAENYDMIGDMTDWVIGQVCLDILKIEKFNISGIKFSVNLSPYDLKEENYYERVLNIIGKNKINLNFFEVEVTESLSVADNPHVIHNLNQFKANNIKVAIDDFGTGYSSLSYLKNLPFDSLKIDRAFISDVSNNSIDKKILKFLVDLTKSLNKELVAEGVENEQQYNTVKESGCDTIQGYLLSKPMPIQEVIDLLIQFNGTK